MPTESSPPTELSPNDQNILYTYSLPLPVSYGTDERDFVLATVLDQDGSLIETKEISVEELKTGELFTFNPGRILRDMGYIAGSYRVKLNFLRRKAGSNTYGFFTGDGELWTGAVHEVNGLIYSGIDPQATDVKRLAEIKMAYDVSAVSPSKKEIRVQTKNIDISEQTSYASNFTHFDSAAYDYIPKSSDDYTSEGTVTVDSSDPYKIKAILTDKDMGFSPAMVGGKLTIDNAYVIAYQTTNASSTANTNTTTTNTNTVTDDTVDEDNPNLDTNLKDETKKETTGGNGNSTKQTDKDL